MKWSHGWYRGRIGILDVKYNVVPLYVITSRVLPKINMKYDLFPP